MAEGSPKTKRRKKHRKLLSRMIKERGSRCEFCFEEVIQIASIPPSDRLKLNAFWLRFRIDSDKIKILRIATIEHVVRLDDGGSYESDNLKVCCAECNIIRNRESQSPNGSSIYVKPAGWCRHCGKTFNKESPRYQHSRSCRVCYFTHSAKFHYRDHLNDL